jgi:hypothetical protein
MYVGTNLDSDMINISSVPVNNQDSVITGLQASLRAAASMAISRNLKFCHKFIKKNIFAPFLLVELKKLELYSVPLCSCS